MVRRREKDRLCCCPNSQVLLFALASNTFYLPAVNMTSVHSRSEVFHVKPEKLTPVDTASEPLLSGLVISQPKHLPRTIEKCS